MWIYNRSVTGRGRCRGAGFRSRPPDVEKSALNQRIGNHEGHEDHEGKDGNRTLGLLFVNFALFVVFIPRFRMCAYVPGSAQNVP